MLVSDFLALGRENCGVVLWIYGLYPFVEVSCGQGGRLAGYCRPCLKEFDMKFGRDFFKILSFVIQIMRLFAAVFGDDDDKKGVKESEERSSSPVANEVC